ncbi:hypothetical protein SEA_LIBERTYBELL_44 [Streptomyces phage LibertyBell]|nr:hypothetical protein SEA_LIBERTYBELL_44 [Streptomyces phage LibertyBell]
MKERTIAVTNPFTGERKEETFYFQLDRADMIDMDILDHDDVEAHLRSIIEGKNAARLIKVVREMILSAVGVKDGTRFVKKGVADRFVEEGFWNALFEELFQEENPMEFIIGILPADVQKEIAAGHEKTYTDDELLAMSDAEFYKAAGVKTMDNMSPHFMQIAVRRRQQKNAA